MSGSFIVGQLNAATICSGPSSNCFLLSRLYVLSILNERVGNMQFNLFSWLREGVKRSVLLGVSDAVETIGTPDVETQLNEQLFAGIEQKSKPSAKRKRLGRSLKDMNETKAISTAKSGT